MYVPKTSLRFSPLGWVEVINLWCDSLVQGAARLYARTDRSFEEVALKFVELGESQALQLFLEDKLACYDEDVCVRVSPPSTCFIPSFFCGRGSAEMRLMMGCCYSSRMSHK